MIDQANPWTQFVATNCRSIEKLRRTHPGSAEIELFHALRHAQSLMEPSNRRRVIAAASFLVGERRTSMDSSDVS
ncbi:MAG: hypothetical protein EOP83_00205 [Verrucomicrobiaceae bacterium]|nr:MAG: hypothetical protein EOP83_00205 [Verrucomicrobiaceae bacterium]